jgi:hypothetical protein
MQRVSLPYNWSVTIKGLLERQKESYEKAGDEVPGVLWNAIEVMKERIEKAKVETLAKELKDNMTEVVVECLKEAGVRVIK